MKKYGIISDIHGNYPALLAVLEECKKAGVDEYIYAGDYYGDFSYPNEVTDLIRIMHNTRVIRGNKEDYLSRMLLENQVDWTYDQFQPLYWNFRELTEENLTFLTSLPSDIAFDAGDGKIIHIAHSSDFLFKNTNTGLFSASKYSKKMMTASFSHEEYLIYVRETLTRDEAFMERLAESPYDIMIFGHTHVQWYVCINGKLLINPGSCGHPLDFDLSAPFTILEHDSDGWRVEEKRVRYELEETLSHTAKTDLFQKARLWCDIHFEMLRTSKDLISPFFTLLHETAAKNNVSAYPYPNEIWQLAGDVWYKRATTGFEIS